VEQKRQRESVIDIVANIRVENDELLSRRFRRGGRLGTRAACRCGDKQSRDDADNSPVFHAAIVAGKPVPEAPASQFESRRVIRRCRATAAKKTIPNATAQSRASTKSAVRVSAYG
jgi:hypothetical protein